MTKNRKFISAFALIFYLCVGMLMVYITADDIAQHKMTLVKLIVNLIFTIGILIGAQYNFYRIKFGKNKESEEDERDELISNKTSKQVLTIIENICCWGGVGLIIFGSQNRPLLILIGIILEIIFAGIIFLDLIFMLINYHRY